MDVVAFVSQRRGYKTPKQLEDGINKLGTKTIGELLDYSRYSSLKKEMFIQVDGEMLASLGMRKIPYEMFKNTWVQLHSNNVTDDFLQKKFHDIEMHEIIQEKLYGVWMYIGISEKTLTEWKSGECLTWVNIGNVDWDLDTSGSFVSLLS